MDERITWRRNENREVSWDDRRSNTPQHQQSQPFLFSPWEETLCSACKHYYSRPRIVLHDETYFYSVYARNPVARLTPWDKGNYWMRRGEGGRGISVQDIYKRRRVRVKSNQWQSRWRCRRFTCVICKWQGGGRFHYETGGVPVYGGTCDNAPRWGRCVIRRAIRAVCGKIFPTR